MKGCPYDLVIEGTISFSEADRKSSDSLYNPESPERIMAAIVTALRTVENGAKIIGERKSYYLSSEEVSSFDRLLLEDAGSCALKEERLLSYTERLLDVEEDSLSSDAWYEALKALYLKGIIETYDSGTSRYVSLRKTFDTEKESARLISEKAKMKVKIPPFINPYRIIEEEAKLSDIPLSQEQIMAVKTSLSSGISVLTGNPGTGKSSALKVLIKSYMRIFKGRSVICVAPTGQAAKRMTEASGYPASTIHSALRLFPGSYDSEVILDAGLVIADEASMIDSFLFLSLMKALGKDTPIVFSGDPNQLPPVGCGNVLSELLKIDAVKASHLTKIFRQKDNSIAFNAAKMIAGNEGLSFDDNFVFLKATGSYEISRLAAKVYREEARRLGEDNVICLTPLRRYTKTGTSALNKTFRKAVRDTRRLSFIDTKSGRIYEKDRIVFLANRYGLVNGDTGYVLSVKEGSCLCRFSDRNVILKGSDLSLISPAFSQTVHKSQGSEYKEVILICDDSHSAMATLPLVYTAVTRAKKKVILIGSEEAFRNALSNNQNMRCSLLSSLVNV